MTPRMCRSTNRRVEPEVYFRIVHVAHNGLNGAPVTASREQSLEIIQGGPHADDSYFYGSPALRRPWATRSLSDGYL